MDLKHITATACPECGCTDTLSIEKRNKHSNGQWNERMSFECGLALHYSPSMRCTSVESDCTKSEKALTWKARRTALATDVVRYLADRAGATFPSLHPLARSLASDLDLYRTELEQVKP